jgi:hypothetical protein
MGTSTRLTLTLIFSISTLNLLVYAFLDLSLQYPCSRGLVEPGCFQDVRSIDPVIGPTAHDVDSRPDIEFVDGYLERSELVCAGSERGNKI